MILFSVEGKNHFLILNPFKVHGRSCQIYVRGCAFQIHFHHYLVATRVCRGLKCQFQFTNYLEEARENVDPAEGRMTLVPCRKEGTCESRKRKDDISI